jgi:pimeloyl-ACP methyl ester carboxylesterase
MLSTIDLNGTALLYDSQGHGPPTLLITGAGALRSIWHHQRAALLAAGHRVVTYDHRGSYPDAGDLSPYGLTELVDDAIALIEALELAPCAVVGFSLGGVIAQEIGVRRPDLVRRMVLIASLARIDRYRAALARGVAAQLRSGVEPPAEYTAALLALRMFSPATLADDVQIAPWLDLFQLSPAQPPSMADQFEVIAAIGDRRAGLAGITAPCLVISFADDASMPRDAGAELAGAIRGSVHRQLPRCGHLGMVEDADGVNALLLEFLDGGRVDRTELSPAVADRA